MEWKEKLISLYLYISENKAIKNYLQNIRQSNNYLPEFTDEEAMTIYIYGILQKRTTVKEIYQYIEQHLKDWFPALPSYQAFDNRLNTIAGAFGVLTNELLKQGIKGLDFSSESVLDSLPIIVAGNRRSSSASVAKGFCDKGYCASKGMYYYGLKFHLLGFVRPGTIPMPECCGVTGASENDLTVARPWLVNRYNRKVYADKIYIDTDFNAQLGMDNNTIIITPIKKQKGQKLEDAADNLYSKAVSGIRQPVESFFNWVIEKTGIQMAVKVRSTNGLLVHVWGKFAAAMCALCLTIFNP
jgi:hypothetical protein